VRSRGSSDCGRDEKAAIHVHHNGFEASPERREHSPDYAAMERECEARGTNVLRSNIRTVSRTSLSQTAEKAVKKTFGIVLRFELLQAAPVRRRESFFGA
jgi:hypothetical protein